MVTKLNNKDCNTGVDDRG